MSKHFQREAQKAWDSGKPKLDAARSVRESYHMVAGDHEYDDTLKNAGQKLEPDSESPVEEYFAPKETRLRVRMRLNRQGFKGWEWELLTHLICHQHCNSQIMDYQCDEYHTRPSFHVLYPWKELVLLNCWLDVFRLERSGYECWLLPPSGA